MRGLREISGASAETERGRLLAPLVQFTAGAALLAAAFIVVARLLLLLPHDYHEGTVWQESVWEEEAQ